MSFVAKYLEKTIKSITFYPEKHELVPRGIWDDKYEHNLWYAKYCIDTLNKLSNKLGIHIIERGVIDRIIIGNAYYKMGWVTKKQLDNYLSILKPSIEKVDRVFCFLIPVEESVKRAKLLGKDVTQAIPYMKVLYQEYKDLKTWFLNAFYLPENATIDELKIIVSKLVFENMIRESV